MTIHPIVICGDPVLSQPTVPVTTFDDDLAAFVYEKLKRRPMVLPVVVEV